MRPSNKKVLWVLAAFLFILPPAIGRAQTKSNEQTPQQKTSLPTLMDFGRNTCMPCKMMKPMLEGLKGEYAGILNVEIIDVRYNPEALKKYRVPGVPFQLVFDASGKELKRRYGYADKGEILALLKSVGIDVQKIKAEKKK
jgi:thioredoxin 1